MTSDNVKVIANYTTYYNYEYLLSDDNAAKTITDSINNTVIEKLKNSNVEGYATIAEYIDDYMRTDLNSQEPIWLEGACDRSASVCDACTTCRDDDPLNVFCSLDCAPDKNEYCLQLDSETVCSCESKYLKIAGDCVHEDWIIGLSVGIGGAVILGLITAIIVMGVRRPSSSSLNSSSKERLSEEDKSQMADECVQLQVESIELVDRNGLASAVVVADAGDSESRATMKQMVEQPQLPQQQPQQRHLTAAAAQPHHIDANGNTGSTEQVFKQPTPDDSNYYCQLAIGQTYPDFVNFQPQLQNVDTDTTFVIRRPRIDQPRNTSSTEFQSISRDFF